MNVHALPVRSRSALTTMKGAAASHPAAKSTHHDPRWPQVAAALSALRAAGRHAVRIVDAECGAGTLLLSAAHHARMLGFTAIEVRGIDRSASAIGRARAAANRAPDAAIGASFEVADIVTALQAEHDLPADIVLCHGGAAHDRRPQAVAALRRAARVVIDDRAASCARSVAA